MRVASTSSGWITLPLTLCLILSDASLIRSAHANEGPVREVIAGLMNAWNVHDMQAFAALFTEDAMFVNVNGSWLQGRAQIEESHKVIHASIFKASTADIKPVAIAFPEGDVAIVHATWRIVGDVRRPEPRDYVMTLILRHQFGRWRIFAAQNGSAEDRSAIGFANLRPGDVAPIPVALPPHTPITEEDRVRSAILEYDSRWNTRTSFGIAALFAAGADYVDTQARWVHGREQIANHILNVERAELGQSTLRSGIERLVFLHGGLVCVQLRWQLDRSAPSSRQIEGMGLRVLQRRASGWQIIASQDTGIRASSLS